MKRLAVILFALAALVGCGPDSGRVITKEHSNAYTDWVMMPQSYPCGKSICQRMHLQPIYHAECWRLVLDTGNTCVSSEEWEATEIGASWVGGEFDERAK